MLFHIKAFRDPNIDSPAKLYSLRVLNGLGEQKLPLREDLDEKFLFCQTIREVDGAKIALALGATTAWIRYQLKKGGEVIGLPMHVIPYVLRDGNAKSLNESSE